MHFTSILVASAAVTGALAGSYYGEAEPEYTTSSVKTCSETVVPEYDSTSVPAYEPTASPEPTDYEAPAPYPDVTYTSYSTYHSDYMVYTATYYSVSKYAAPVPTYPAAPSKNCTTTPAPYPTPEPYPTTEEPAPYPTEEPEHYPEETITYTKTYVTSVCPGKSYCYATTTTSYSTYCPGSTHVDVPKTYEPAPEKPTYAPVPPPTYTKPSYNDTTPTYSPPPSYTGAASSNAVSFGVAAFAGLVALFVAA